MTFEHNLKEYGEKTQVTHRVIFQGRLSFIFGKLIGNNIKKGLPTALSELKKTCEQGK